MFGRDFLRLQIFVLLLCADEAVLGLIKYFVMELAVPGGFFAVGYYSEFFTVCCLKFVPVDI